MEIDKNTEATVARSEADAPAQSESSAPDGAKDDELVLQEVSLHEKTGFGGKTILWAILGSLFALFALAIILAFSVGSRSWGFGEQWGWDQYILKPGSATSATDAIEIEGRELFPADGDIAYTTVAIVRDPSVVDITWSKYQDGHILVDPVLIDRNETREETRERTRIQMVRSQSDAAVVALTYLGYDLQTVERGAVVVEAVSENASQTFVLGDTVVGANGSTIGLVQDLTGLLANTVPGDILTLDVQRATTGQVETIQYELGQRPPPDPGQPAWTPEQANSGFMGVVLENDPSLVMPFEVSVNVGEVRGPSAGLAFSLAIVEVLTPGSLTGGLKVATTGTIDSAGNVGAVGGVHQKTLAAEEAGMDIFMVPSSEFAEATLHADKMEVVEVNTFAEALAALAERGGNGLEVADSLGDEA